MREDDWEGKLSQLKNSHKRLALLAPWLLRFKYFADNRSNMADPRILLISSPPEEGTESARTSLPLALAYLSAYTKDIARQVDILDLSNLGNLEITRSAAASGVNTHKLLMESVKRLAPIYDIIGVNTSMSIPPYVHDTIMSAKSANKDAWIIAGGTYSTRWPWNLLEKTAPERSADAVVRGEGEITFRKLVQTIERIKRDKNKIDKLKPVRGISFLDSKKRRFSSPDRAPLNVNNMRLPDFSGLDFKNYRGRLGVSLPVYSTRGCPHNCKFCTVNIIWGKKVRMMSAKTVLDYVDKLTKRWKFDYVRFLDDTFTLDRERVLKVCRGFQRSNLKDMPKSCLARVDNFCLERDPERPDVELAKNMEAAGFRAIQFGVESFADNVLKDLNKGFRQAHVEAALKTILDNTKMQVVAFMIMMTPHITRADLEYNSKRMQEFNNNKKYEGQLLFSTGLRVGVEPGSRYEQQLRKEGLLHDEAERFLPEHINYSYADPRIERLINQRIENVWILISEIIKLEKMGGRTESIASFLISAFQEELIDALSFHPERIQDVITSHMEALKDIYIKRGGNPKKVKLYR